MQVTVILNFISQPMGMKPVEALPAIGPVRGIPTTNYPYWNHHWDVRPMELLPPKTRVYQDFISQPMGMKPVEALAGIGSILGARLRCHGFVLARQVFFKFLDSGRDPNMFMPWLFDLTKANRKCISDCYLCLNEWYNKFFIGSSHQVGNVLNRHSFGRQW